MHYNPENNREGLVEVPTFNKTMLFKLKRDGAEVKMNLVSSEIDYHDEPLFAYDKISGCVAAWLPLKEGEIERHDYIYYNPADKQIRTEKGEIIEIGSRKTFDTLRVKSLGWPDMLDARAKLQEMLGGPSLPIEGSRDVSDNDLSRAA